MTTIIQLAAVFAIAWTVGEIWYRKEVKKIKCTSTTMSPNSK